MTVARFVVDTDVLSETARPTPHAGVLAWLAQQGQVAIASVTIYELARGVARVPVGKRRRFLDAWLARLLATDNEVLSFGRDAALTAARLEAHSRHRGRPIDVRDLFILASAKAAGLGVATRNVDHFRGHGVDVYDPFADRHVT